MIEKMMARVANVVALRIGVAETGIALKRCDVDEGVVVANFSRENGLETRDYFGFLLRRRVFSHFR